MEQKMNQSEQERLLRDALIRVYALEEALVRTGKLTTKDLRDFQVAVESSVDQEIRRACARTSPEKP